MRRWRYASPLKPETEEEIRRCHEMGITDVNQVLTLDDLVRTDDVIFAATAITRGNLLNAINTSQVVRVHILS